MQNNKKPIDKQKNFFLISPTDLNALYKAPNPLNISTDTIKIAIKIKVGLVSFKYDFISSSPGLINVKVNEFIVSKNKKNSKKHPKIKNKISITYLYFGTIRFAPRYIPKINPGPTHI